MHDHLALVSSKLSKCSLEEIKRELGEAKGRLSRILEEFPHLEEASEYPHPDDEEPAIIPTPHEVEVINQIRLYKELVGILKLGLARSRQKDVADSSERQPSSEIKHSSDSQSIAVQEEENIPSAEAKGTTSTTKPRLSASEKRAQTVATVIKEINNLVPQMDHPSDYGRLKERYSDYRIWSVTDERPDLKLKLENIQGHKQYIRFAHEIVASIYRKKRSTIETDWKDHKPDEFRQARSEKQKKQKKIK